MPSVYEIADASVNEFTTRVMALYHGGLSALETTVDILMASPPRAEEHRGAAASRPPQQRQLPRLHAELHHGGPADATPHRRTQPCYG